MRTDFRIVRRVAATFAALAVSVSVAAQGAGSITFVPPDRGAPVRSVGGGTRGATKLVVVAVLAPEASGLTLSRQPTLYWYASTDWLHEIEVTVVSADSDEPLMAATMQRPTAAGISSVSLADHGVHLEAGKRYQWGVTFKHSSGDEFKNIYTQGGIEWQPAPTALLDRLTTSKPEERASILAAEGIWYDAIDILSRSITRTQGSQATRAQRSSLLKQVNLDDAANYDSNAIALN